MLSSDTLFTANLTSHQIRKQIEFFQENKQVFSGKKKQILYVSEKSYFFIHMLWQLSYNLEMKVFKFETIGNRLDIFKWHVNVKKRWR